jgi:uncharacterized membrane protein
MFGRGDQPPTQYPYWEHTGHGDHGWEWLVALVLFALIVGVVAALVVRWLAARQARAQALPLVPAAVGPADDALGTVRMRYARGEIDREQFLQATADLGGAGPYPVAEQPVAEQPVAEQPVAEQPDAPTE